MEKDKNFEELLAAIGGGVASSSATPPAPAPVPAPRLPAAAASLRPPQPAAAPKYTGNVAGNLDELVNLLGGSPAPAASTPQPIARPRSSSYPATAYPMMPAQQRPQSQPPMQGMHAGVDGQAAAQYRRQQIHAARDMQKREAAMNPARPTQSTLAANKTAGAPLSAPLDITAELTAVMQKSGASDSSKSQPGRPSAAAAAVQRGVGRPNQSNQVSQANQPAGVGGRQRAQITQEQIIVGHFCRHAIKTLTRVMEGNTMRLSTEAGLKEHIKSVWAQWVRGVIPRQRLLESVASFVRHSCPQAASIDVIKEFKTWYEREYELQKRRTSTGPRVSQVQQRHPPQPQMSQQQIKQQPQLQMQPMHAQPQRKVQAARPVGGALSANGANASQRGQPPMRPTPPAKQVPKQEMTISGSKPPSITPALGFGVENQLNSRTGGKSISSKTIPPRKAQMAKPTKTAAVKPSTGKGVASKATAGKSLSRPPVATAKAQVENKGPPSQSPAKPSLPPKANSSPGAKGLTGGKGITGNKGIVGNKSAANAKSKTTRKLPAKASPKSVPKTISKTGLKAPSKTTGKSTPKNAAPKGKTGPGVAAGAMSTAAPGAQISQTGKRPLDLDPGAAAGSAPKKPKAISKGSKGIAGRKKTLTGSPGNVVPKGTKTTLVKDEPLKGRPPSSPGHSIAGSASLGVAKATPVGPVGVNAGHASQIKKNDHENGELSVLRNSVDIEFEQDMLGRDANAGSDEVVEVLDYDSDLLLSGPILRKKMQAAVRRHGLDENVSKETMEMISLSVRERLASIVESLKKIKAVRMEENRAGWNTEPIGPDLYEKLEQMRQDEERTLTVAAEMRIRRKKESEEREAKKLASEAAQEEKKTKDSTAAAEAERKEKLALEKKRKEHSSQSDALSGLIDKRRKRPASSKGLAPLGPLGPPGSIGGSKNSGAGLPPIPHVNSDSTGGKKSSTADRTTAGRKIDQLEGLKPLGPLVKLGRLANVSGNTSKGTGAPKRELRTPIELRDCLFLMEQDRNTRKSSLLYKWMARVSARDLFK